MAVYLCYVMINHGRCTTTRSAAHRRPPPRRHKGVLGSEQSGSHCASTAEDWLDDCRAAHTRVIGASIRSALDAQKHAHSTWHTRAVRRPFVGLRVIFRYVCMHACRHVRRGGAQPNRSGSACHFKRIEKPDDASAESFVARNTL